MKKPNASGLSFPEHGRASITAVITCHNYGRYLEQCLRSVLDQELPFTEIILVDDASIDQTPFIAEKYLGSIRYLRLRAGNPAMARQYGYRVSKGDYVVMIDADDWLHPEYTVKMLPPLLREPGAGLSYCGANLSFEGDCSWYPADIHRMEEFSEETLSARNYIPNCSLVRREAWLGQSVTLGALEDWDHWLRIVKSGWKAVLVPERLFYYRIHEGSRSHRELTGAAGPRL